MSLEGTYRLKEILSKFSPEETQFFMTPVAPILPKEEYRSRLSKGQVDVYNSLIQDRFTLLLNIDQPNGIIKQIVVPPRLYSALLEAKFGENAMRIDPILGYSSKEKLSDTEKRIQGIPCPFVQMPKTVHHVIDTRDPLALFWHDQSHLYIESANPHRPFWTELAQSFKDKDPALYVILLDRNFPLYSEPKLFKRASGRKDLSSKEIFFYNLPFLANFEPNLWDGSRGMDRIEAVLKEFVKRGISLDPLEKIANREPGNHLFSLHPWAKAAKRLSSS